MEAVVAEVRQETHDTASLFLDIGEEPRDYEAGQFITIDPHQFGFLQQTIALPGGDQERPGRSRGPTPWDRLPTRSTS